MFFTNGSYEYWGRAASLIHTSPDGKTDVPPDANTRIYFFAGSQHGAGIDSAAQGGGAESGRQSTITVFAQRALLLRDAGLAEGRDGAAAVAVSAHFEGSTGSGRAPWRFPQIEGVRFRLPNAKPTGWTSAPSRPSSAIAYPTLVPQVDQDGNETSGIRMPESRGAAGILHGLEPAEPKRSGAGRALQLGRILDSVPADTASSGRTARIRALSIEERYHEQARVSRKDHRSRAELVQRRLSAGGRCAAHSRSRGV